jgi:hypothetical protein
LQFSDHVLDHFVGPECSKFTKCDMPDIDEPSDLLGSYILSSLFIADSMRALIIVLLRRHAQAVREYKAARSNVVGYIARLPVHAPSLYFQATCHLEQSVSNLYQALEASQFIGHRLDPGWKRNSFDRHDGSPAQKLNSIYNATKHFENHLNHEVAPIWLVEEGVRCREFLNNGAAQVITLLFTEMLILMQQLEENGRFLAEDVFKQVAERRKSSP